MNLFTGNDTVTTCEDCGQPARQREIVAAHGRHARLVPFQTHAQSLDEGEHLAVFARVKAFYERMFDLLDELQGIGADDCRLTYGRLVRLDLGAVMPTACARRTEIIPLATVRVAGIEREVRLAARLLAESDAAGILAELKATAEPMAAQMNAQFEARDF